MRVLEASAIVIVGLVFVLLVFVLYAILGGLAIWIIYPLVIPAVFPGLVDAGYISSKIPFWVSIFLFMMCQFLFRANVSSYKGKK